MGVLPLIAFLLILLLPLLLFSSFNPISMPNDLRSFSVDVDLEIDNFGKFNIYRVNNAMSIRDFT